MPSTQNYESINHAKLVSSCTTHWMFVIGRIMVMVAVSASNTSQENFPVEVTADVVAEDAILLVLL